jgi:hypothetical protein
MIVPRRVDVVDLTTGHQAAPGPIVGGGGPGAVEGREPEKC